MRRPAAFFSGLVLVGVLLLMIHLLGMLPPIHPLLRRLGLQQPLLQEWVAAGLHALPVYLLSLVWSYITVRPLRRGSKPTTTWCFTGLLLGWLAAVLFGLLDASNQAMLGRMTTTELLLVSGLPPFWGLLNFAAAVLGVLLAGRRAWRNLPVSSRLSAGSGAATKPAVQRP